MSDVNIKIGTQGDVTGLQQIQRGYQDLIQKAKQAAQSMKAHSPMHLAADRQLHDRKMGELDRKAADIERKIASIKLDMAKTGATSAPELANLEQQSRVVGLERSVVGGDLAAIQNRQMSQRRMAGRFMAPARYVGRAATGKVMRYGGAIAGLLGAYSLLSKVGGAMGDDDLRNQEYALAASQLRGSGADFSTSKPFFDVGTTLKELGQTAYMTAKDMLPMLEAAKELGDISREASREHTGLVNIGKSLKIDPQLIGEIINQSLKKGSFQAGGQYADSMKAMMLNQNMMHRATESLQAMQSVMTSTSHGTQALGHFGAANLLDTLNNLGLRNYMGQGGADAIGRIDQAFRGGGNENFQYFQTMALHPAFQKRNAERLAAWRASSGGAANYGSGRYDMIIADIFKELGSMATPADVAKQLKGLGHTGASAYVEKMYGDSMNKSNLERTFEVYRSTFGSKNEGRRLFMEMQMAKDLGVGFTDIAVLNKAMQDKNFMKSAREGGWSNEEITQRWRAYTESGKDIGTAKSFLTEREKTQATWDAIAEGLNALVAELRPYINDIMKPFAEYMKGEFKSDFQAFTKELPGFWEDIKTAASGIASLVNFFTGDDEPPAPPHDPEVQLANEEEYIDSWRRSGKMVPLKNKSLLKHQIKTGRGFRNSSGMYKQSPLYDFDLMDWMGSYKPPMTQPDGKILGINKDSGLFYEAYKLLQRMTDHLEGLQNVAKKDTSVVINAPGAIKTD